VDLLIPRNAAIMAAGTKRGARLPRGITTLVLAAALSGLAAGSVRAQPTPSRDDLQKSLRTFCELRMRELEAKAQKNLAAVQWQQDATGARGEYVGYNPDYVCTLSSGEEQVPIGRMQYREIHFEKRGASIQDAMRADPEPLRFEDVTQVFAYRRGVWE
jgi:hypothetical protein